MRSGFYPRLAADSIRKNRRMFLPYLLTCVGMVMMTYLIHYVRYAEVISALPGGGLVQELMAIGGVVIVFFAAIFLFYTNSFLIRQRKKEFGLYNILGMGKGNLGRILFWESFYIMILSLVAGLVLGIAFSKLAELGLVNMMKGQVTYSLTVPIKAIIFTVLPFTAIFALLFFNTLRQVWLSSAISLLKSENAGEKPPRANWFVGVSGVLILGGAYYLAVSIQDPIAAIYIFMVAVLMVILATYLIMIAGSVLFCRILQKRKSYYYRPNHFVSVASMVYRMKRNGAGLASICILATMVLVMISSTSALFIGGEDVIRNRYPREINAQFRSYSNRDVTGEEIALITDTIDETLRKHGTEKSSVVCYSCAVTSGLLNHGEVFYDQAAAGNFDLLDFADLHQVYLIPAADYNAMMGEKIDLQEDEVLIFAPRTRYDSEVFAFTGHRQYRVREILKDCFLSPDMSMDIVSPLMVVVPDLSAAAEGLVDQEGNELVYYKWCCYFDTSLEGEDEIVLWRDLQEVIGKLELSGRDTLGLGISIESREYERQDFYSLYGGLFYLGVMLSIVFVFAAVLIIYYKQISEGYEDQARFEIMQKVGMTKKDIRRSINSQLLTVFFLPLAGAGLHLVFAFPIIEKLLLLFNLSNHKLFIGTTAVSFLVFALFYVIVYRITSNAYYQIVSGTK